MFEKRSAVVVMNVKLCHPSGKQPTMNDISMAQLLPPLLWHSRTTILETYKTMDIQEQNSPEDFLFEGIGEIDQKDILAWEKERARDFAFLFPGDRKGVQGSLGPGNAKNRFSIGNPVSISLEEFQRISGFSLPAQSPLQRDRYVYCAFFLACSFVPDTGYYFHNARFEVALQTLDADGQIINREEQEQALAYSLFSLKGEASSGHTARQETPPPPTAFGLLEPCPGWQFTRTPSCEINGYYSLYLLIRQPIGTRVQATFSLTADLQFILDPIHFKTILSAIMRFHRYNSTGTIIDATVELPSDEQTGQNRFSERQATPTYNKEVSLGTTKPEKAIEVFFAYARADQDLRNRLEEHLSLLKHQGLISTWHDRKIGAGRAWATSSRRGR